MIPWSNDSNLSNLGGFEPFSVGRLSGSNKTEITCGSAAPRAS